MNGQLPGLSEVNDVRPNLNNSRTLPTSVAPTSTTNYPGQCRDCNGKKIKKCRKPHGSWAFVVDAGTDPETGKCRQIPRSGFKTKTDRPATSAAV
jgi:hypothetical protein